jgi:hypothetical protein
VFLCQSCHWKSKCRSEVHLGISRERCVTCGCLLDCFDCTSPQDVLPKPGVVAALIKMYRNTKQVTYKE